MQKVIAKATLGIIDRSTSRQSGERMGSGFQFTVQKIQGSVVSDTTDLILTLSYQDGTQERVIVTPQWTIIEHPVSGHLSNELPVIELNVPDSTPSDDSAYIVEEMNQGIVENLWKPLKFLEEFNKK